MDLSTWHAGAFITAVCGAPGALLLLEVCLARRRTGESSSDEPLLRPTFRVLIPAHDEAAGIGACLEALIPLLPSPSTALVVADNCSDETASIATAFGVEVLVREASELRGKGYALKYGLDHLSQAPPDCVVFLDADCSYLRGGPSDLAALAVASGRPAQGLFLMDPPSESSLGARAAAFAVRVKNDLRARGLSQLGGAVSLQGSSFALSWDACSAVSPPVDELAEDAVWGWRLADKGWPPLFSTQTACSGQLASGREANQIQRARWERGTLLGAWRVLPGVFVRSLMRGRLAVSVLALDGLVPPLSLLAFACSVWALVGVQTGISFAQAVAPISILASGVLISWLRVGRDLIAPYELVGLLAHGFARICRFPATILSGSEWRRTPRDGAVEAHDHSIKD
jgi:cellulose synthase/poly-beta-1,6-N-acetylglucosamine synthase-like glycosyltransferase